LRLSVEGSVVGLLELAGGRVCEVTVTKGAPATCGGTQNPTCCCGKTMDLING
jgi:hypothetical protein